MTNHRTTARATGPSPLLVAGAAALALLAAFAAVLLRPAAGHAAPAKGPLVATATTGLGRVLVNASGRTLYLFEKDKNGKSACTGQCATFWPPLLASAMPRSGTGVKASLLGTTKRADGRMQVTYAHHPLYTFQKDTKKGQTTGQNVNAFGAEWYTVSPAGAAVKKSVAAAPTTTAPASGGGGYGG